MQRGYGDAGLTPCLLRGECFVFSVWFKYTPLGYVFAAVIAAFVDNVDNVDNLWITRTCVWCGVYFGGGCTFWVYGGGSKAGVLCFRDGIGLALYGGF